MDDVVKAVRQQLKRNADEKTRESGERFFKEKVNLYGVKSAVVRKIGKEYFKVIKDKNKSEIFSLCEELWRSGYTEEASVACDWSYFLRDHYEPKDFKIFERWVDDFVSNWAECDVLCNHTVGAFIEKYPDYLSDLKRWAKSKNRWMRRAAAVSLIVPARRGKFLEDIFEIADILLLDEDDLVQKGYGWMLKVASQSYEKQVFDYVVKNKGEMPRTALRYAIEKMPSELKTKAMEK
jgi:3-methyladenine DNA glycosylase AlkD